MDLAILTTDISLPELDLKFEEAKDLTSSFEFWFSGTVTGIRAAPVTVTSEHIKVNLPKSKEESDLVSFYGPLSYGCSGGLVFDEKTHALIGMTNVMDTHLAVPQFLGMRSSFIKQFMVSAGIIEP